MSWFKELWQNSREKGLYYEKQAESYLKQHGLKTIECNYLCQYGELDLIMREGNTLVFVECIEHSVQHSIRLRNLKKMPD